MDIIQIADGQILITWESLLSTVVCVGAVGFISGVFIAIVDTVRGVA